MKRKSNTILEDVYTLLKEGIKEGRYAPGQRLVEVDLIEEFEIGRSTVRELLRRLAGDRLIDYAPHRSAVVRSLSRDEVADIYLLREHLEGLAARLAARFIDRPGTRKKLLKIMPDFEEVSNISIAPEFHKHNEDFHSLIVELSGSHSMHDLCELLVLPTFRFQFARYAGPDTTVQAIQEHENILKAILAGDEGKAEKEMRHHVRNAAKMIQQLPDNAFRRERTGTSAAS